MEKALLEGHQEHDQCANEWVGWMVFSFCHCDWSSSLLDFWRKTEAYAKLKLILQIPGLHAFGHLN